MKRCDKDLWEKPAPCKAKNNVTMTNWFENDHADTGTAQEKIKQFLKGTSRLPDEIPLIYNKIN